MEVGEHIRGPEGYGKFHARALQRIYGGLRYGWNATVASELADRFVTYFRIENRYPFFDRRLVEFCLALPEDQRLEGRWTKKVLRQAMGGILPRLVENRKDKADFTPVVDTETMKRQAHKLENLILTSSLATLGIINSDLIRRLFEEYREGIAVDDGVRNVFLTIVWLELWYRSDWQN
jgi:asparagine synthetase B (glutamine-hydrolysing)